MLDSIKSYSDVKALPEAGWVWQGRLDDKYSVIVLREAEPYKAELLIFGLNEDEEEKEEILFRQDVGLAYNAQFGPDWDDVFSWQNIAIKFADEPTVAVEELLQQDQQATDTEQVKHLGDAAVSKTAE